MRKRLNELQQEVNKDRCIVTKKEAKSGILVQKYEIERRVRMSVGAWIMLIIYAVGLGGGSIALLAYSLRKNDI